MLPNIRNDLEFLPAQTEDGQQIIVIRDPLEILEENLVIDQGTMMMFQFLNSSETIKDLQLLLMRLQGGQLISQEEIETMIKELEEKYLLDTENYRQKREEVKERFLGQKKREAYCAGSSYPEDPEELTELIAATLQEAKAPEIATPLQAIVSPHIDLQVGLDAYGQAYKVLEKAESKPDLVVVLGVGHQMVDDLFSVTEKDFITPLGRVKTATELVKPFWEFQAVSDDDFYHKQEHSIEFQLLFLQHLLGKDNFEIVPILCGSYYQHRMQYNRAGEIPEVQEVLDEIRGILEKDDREVLLVAGVDFSHIGLKFGDEKTAHELAPDAEEHDRALLDALVNRDAAAFWAESKRVEDCYHVCGFATLANLLEIFPQGKSEVLHYHLWREEPTQSAVSYASVAFLE